MTVYWCDPYLESSNGGIHGTTGNGSGTYASPWKLSHLLHGNSSNVYSSISNGDEIRFKGLPDSDFWDSPIAWSNIQNQGSPQYSYKYDISGASAGKFYYAKTFTGGDRVYCHIQSGYNYFKTALDDHWGANYPKLQGATSGNNQCYPFKDAYRMQQSVIYSANGSSTSHYFLRVGTSSGYLTGVTQFNGLKITAGWTSETQKNGITYIAFDTSTTTSGHSHYWGGDGSSQVGFVEWDCYDGSTVGNTTGGLYIGKGGYADVRVCGGDVKLYGLCDSNYGYNSKYIYNNSNVSMYFMGGNGAAYWENYIRQDYSNADAPDTETVFEVRCDVSCTGYNNNMNVYFPTASTLASFSDSTPRHIKFRSKVFTGYYGRKFNCYTSDATGQATITFDNGWYFGYYSGSVDFSDNTVGLNPVTETIGTEDTGQPYMAGYSSVKENTGFGGLGQYPQNSQSWYNQASSPRKLISSATSIFGQSSTSSHAYRAYNHTIQMASGETYETATGNPLTFSAAPYSHVAAKTVVLSNTADFRPCTLMGPEAAEGPGILICNSPSNSNKLLWHFFNNNNGKSYTDSFALQIPDYSTYNLRLNGDFTITAGTSITMEITLFYTKNQTNSPSFQTAQKFGPFNSPTTTSTSIVFSETITSTDLTNANPHTMWAWVKATKGNNTKGNIIYNQLDLTQIT